MATDAVEVFGLDNEGREIRYGSLRWDGAKIVADPDTDLLRRIAETPIVARADGQLRRLTPADGLAFLAALPQQYRTPYARAEVAREEPPGTLPATSVPLG
jgi:hypothetical protein